MMMGPALAHQRVLLSVLSLQLLALPLLLCLGHRAEAVLPSIHAKEESLLLANQEQFPRDCFSLLKDAMHGLALGKPYPIVDLPPENQKAKSNNDTTGTGPDSGGGAASRSKKNRPEESFEQNYRHKKSIERLEIPVCNNLDYSEPTRRLCRAAPGMDPLVRVDYGTAAQRNPLRQFAGLEFGIDGGSVNGFQINVNYGVPLSLFFEPPITVLTFSDGEEKRVDCASLRDSDIDVKYSMVSPEADLKYGTGYYAVWHKCRVFLDFANIGTLHVRYQITFDLQHIDLLTNFTLASPAVSLKVYPSVAVRSRPTPFQPSEGEVRILGVCPHAEETKQKGKKEEAPVPLMTGDEEEETGAEKSNPQRVLAESWCSEGLPLANNPRLIKEASHLPQYLASSVFIGNQPSTSGTKDPARTRRPQPRGQKKNNKKKSGTEEPPFPTAAYELVVDYKGKQLPSAVTGSAVDQKISWTLLHKFGRGGPKSLTRRPSFSLSFRIIPIIDDHTEDLRLLSLFFAASQNTDRWNHRPTGDQQHSFSSSASTTKKGKKKGIDRPAAGSAFLGKVGEDSGNNSPPITVELAWKHVMGYFQPRYRTRALEALRNTHFGNPEVRDSSSSDENNTSTDTSGDDTYNPSEEYSPTQHLVMSMKHRQRSNLLMTVGLMNLTAFTRKFLAAKRNFGGASSSELKDEDASSRSTGTMTPFESNLFDLPLSAIRREQELQFGWLCTQDATRNVGPDFLRRAVREGAPSALAELMAVLPCHLGMMHTLGRLHMVAQSSLALTDDYLQAADRHKNAEGAAAAGEGERKGPAAQKKEFYAAAQTFKGQVKQSHSLLTLIMLHGFEAVLDYLEQVYSLNFGRSLSDTVCEHLGRAMSFQCKLCAMGSIPMKLFTLAQKGCGEDFKPRFYQPAMNKEAAFKELLIPQSGLLSEVSCMESFLGSLHFGRFGGDYGHLPRKALDPSTAVTAGRIRGYHHRHHKAATGTEKENSERLRVAIAAMKEQVLPYARYLTVHLNRTVEVNGRTFTTFTETAKAINGDNWVWTDDNAKSLELLLLPGVYEDPAIRPNADSALDFVVEMMTTDLILRRVATAPTDANTAAGFKVESEPQPQPGVPTKQMPFRLHSGLMDFQGTPQQIAQGYRFHDNRNADVIRHVQPLQFVVRFATITHRPPPPSHGGASKATEKNNDTAISVTVLEEVIDISPADIQPSFQLVEREGHGLAATMRGPLKTRNPLILAHLRSLDPERFPIAADASAPPPVEEIHFADVHYEALLNATRSSTQHQIRVVPLSPRLTLESISIAFATESSEDVCLGQFCASSMGSVNCEKLSATTFSALSEERKEEANIFVVQSSAAKIPASLRASTIDGSYEQIGSAPLSPGWLSVTERGSIGFTYGVHTFVHNRTAFTHVSYSHHESSGENLARPCFRGERLGTVKTHYLCERVSQERPCLISEGRLLTAGGLYEEMNRYERLFGELAEGKDEGLIDYSISYDIGAELHALSGMYLFRKAGFYEPSVFPQDDPLKKKTEAPGERSGSAAVGSSSPSVGGAAAEGGSSSTGSVLGSAPLTLPALRRLIDRHLDVYFRVFAKKSPDGTSYPNVFVRGLGYILATLNNMLAATGDAKYSDQILSALDVLVKTRVRKYLPLFRCMGSEGWPSMDCQAGAAFGIARILASYPFGLSMKHQATKESISDLLRGSFGNMWLRMDANDVQRLSKEKPGMPPFIFDDVEHMAKFDTFEWTFKCSILLRAMGALQVAKTRFPELVGPWLGNATIHELHKECQTYLDKATVRHEEDGTVEIKTSAFSTETNTETQPWGTLGQFAHLVEPLFQAASINQVERSISGRLETFMETQGCPQRPLSDDERQEQSARVGAAYRVNRPAGYVRSINAYWAARQLEQTQHKHRDAFRTPEEGDSSGFYQWFSAQIPSRRPSSRSSHPLSLGLPSLVLLVLVAVGLLAFLRGKTRRRGKALLAAAIAWARKRRRPRTD